MNEILVKISKKYMVALEKQSPDDKESNVIYGKMLHIL